MSYKVRNVNIAHELLLEAAEEYSGFVLGLREGSVVNAIFGNSAAEGGSQADPEALALEKAQRRFFTKVLDRTNGALCLNDIDGAAKKELGTEDIPTVQSLVTVVHASNELVQPGGGVMPQNDDTMGIDNVFDAMFQAHGMKSVLMSIDHSLITRDKVEIPAESGTDSERSADDPKKFKIVIPSVANADANLVNDLLNTTISNSEIDRFLHPSFGSITIKHPAFGFNSRQATHLPVFLGGVTPIEMSRCTPFLDVKILTRKRSRVEGDESGKRKMGIWNFMRIMPPEDDAWSGDKGPYPVDTTLEENPEYTERYYNFMDVFQSPQTMVNAEINKGASFMDRLDEALKSDNPFEEYSSGDDFAFTSVKDPMQPFMSLIDFNVSISGIGHGLMATKRAFLKIKLHDKSRIADLAEFLSPNDFAFTKFIIEYGWSHPDGNVTSTNTIGRYLNALRDAGVYQLVNADYSFGQDNSVDITLNLVCSGFQQMKMISAAGGRHANLATFQGTIDNILKEISNRKLAKAESVDAHQTQKLKEIRGKLKITNRNLKSKSMLIPFQDAETGTSNMEALRSLLNDVDIDSDLAVKKVLGFIFGEHSTEEDIDVSSYEAIANQANSVLIKRESDTAGNIIFAKLYSLDKTPDPFVSHVGFNYYEAFEADYDTVGVHNMPLIGSKGTYANPTGAGVTPTGDLTVNDFSNTHISLGKILSMFVGYPMATCGLYDEVQMVFYPVNSQSAGARKHTTASFPIELNKLREEVSKRAVASDSVLNNLSVHGFFSILDKIVSNQTITAYGLFSKEVTAFSQKLEEFANLDLEAKATLADTPDIELTEAEAELISRAAEEAEASNAAAGTATDTATKRAKAEAYMRILSNRFNDQRNQRLSEIYKEDEANGVKGLYDPDSFSAVNLSMFFETTTVSAADTDDDSGAWLKKIAGLGRREITSNGLRTDKTILKIHVYDQYSNMDPDLAVFGTDASPQGTPLTDSLTNTLTTAEVQKKKHSYAFFKNLLMNAHPTIIHGASTGVVNSISVNSNTSGQLSNILIVEAYDRSVNGGSTSRDQPDFDETILFPTTVDLEIAGFPMLSRGAQIFIDFGTQTSLDNLYVVKTVDHMISQGVFKTRAILVASNQFAVTSFRDRLVKKAAKLAAGEGSS